jgi:hypothetical protein
MPGLGALIIPFVGLLAHDLMDRRTLEGGGMEDRVGKVGDKLHRAAAVRAIRY